MEQEIETVLVLTKKLKLRTVTGQLIAGFMKVFECEKPYVIVALVDTEFGQSLRMDVHKEDLAIELRTWLEGKQIRNPAVLIPVRIEDAINRFVKFGKTPLQEDLVMWMLSRSELYLGSAPELVFGGKAIDPKIFHDTNDYKDLTNEYNRNAMAAVGGDHLTSQQYRIEDAVGRGANLGFNMFQSGERTSSQHYKQSTPRSAKPDTQDLGMFEMTRKLLGKSATMEMLKKSRVKGREGAKQTVASSTWNSEHLALVTSVEKARKNIEAAMDERRRMIEVAKARQLQASEKFRKIRHGLEGNVEGAKFVTVATQELLSLQKMEEDIWEDIKRQRNRAQRTAQKVSWTMAPSGFVNRRGKSQRGPVLGSGPLHPNATSSLKDPRVESTVRRYYWDSAGRRHQRDGVDDVDEASLVEKALEAIRRAAANITAFKLDLKAVFEEFDTSGDGFLSPPEMAEAFLSMGVQLDVESMVAIFKHFDPNDSGSVHFGEFVWAFFNRRNLVRQWKRKTDGMTETDIKNKFHLADINGDGRLNPREFKKLLKAFGMEMSPADVEILIDRFDLDGDGDIDLPEFRAFIESEQKNLFEAESAGTRKAQTALPQPKTQRYKAGAQDDSAPSQRRSDIYTRSGGSVGGGSGGGGPARPSSAPRGRAPAPAPRSYSTAPVSALRRGGDHLSKSVQIRAPYDDEEHVPQSAHKNMTYPSPAVAKRRPQEAQDNDDDDEEYERAVSGPGASTGAERGAWRMDSIGAAVAEMRPLAEDRTAPHRRGGGGNGAAAPPQQSQQLTADEVADEDVDVLWVSRMLQAQAEVEARLGKRYFN